MNTLSWGLRSELLTKSHALQAILISLLNKEVLTQRYHNQLQEAENFLTQIKEIKLSEAPTYILVEKHALECTGIIPISSHWQRIFDGISIEELDKALPIFNQLVKEQTVVGEQLLKVNELLIKISMDISYS